VSNDRLNFSSDDIIVYPLTSSTKRRYVLEIDEADIIDGELMQKSSVRYDNPLTIEKLYVRNLIARVSKAFFAQVKEKIIGMM